jgi:2-amino-4-hydroxy-6-hydroxymethyldihydropteridine diphosphokinase
MAECLIGLGSNLGDRSAQLERACQLLCGHPRIHCGGRSTFHPTPPIGGPTGQGPFLNAALRVTTSLSPQQLLAAARRVEQQVGRERRERWGPRVIDIDVLLYDQRVEETDELVLPHPRMALRRFVLAPACEVASHMVHPSTGWTVAELLHRLDEPPHYVAIAGIDAGQTMNLAATSARVSGAHLLLDPLPPRYPPDLGDVETTSGRHELRALAARREQLSGLSAAAHPSSTDWHVCDYWLPQSLAVARAWLDGPARRQVERACVLATRQVPPPHCVVCLATPSAGVDAAAGAHGSQAAPSAPRYSAATLARELSHQASLPGQGPILRIPGGDLRLALTELTAAIDAMR